MENIMIWGCGKFGKLAYYYFKDNKEVNIIGFIDSNSDKWGTQFFDKEIYPPKVMEEYKGQVVIAVKNGYENIESILKKTYGIQDIILFGISTQTLSNHRTPDSFEEVDKDSIMIYFLGGLGNQMFQYALAKNWIMQGKKVVANIKHYYEPGTREFILKDVFKNINLNFAGNDQKKAIILKNAEDSFYNYKNFRIYSEEQRDGMEKIADMSLLDMTGGVVSGYFANYRYAEKVERELRQDFNFSANNDRKLNEIIKKIQENNCVSVHIRRGDYMTEQNQRIYGGICTLEYYINAMKLMKEKVGSCIFCFLSNDIEWVKENFPISDAIYINSEMFEDYNDWYDMYIMTQCKHNIIANSTFSWWGAWLNQNTNKIVIAPKKWINIYDYKDIYPSNWITI